MTGPRIAPIHATPIAVDPVHAAPQDPWPRAQPVDITDCSLPPDREAAGRIDDALARDGLRTGAQAVLFACPAFGSAIERPRDPCGVPVPKPDEAMFGAAMAAGRRVAMICPVAPAAASRETGFREDAGRLGRGATIRALVVPGAIQAARAGDVAACNRLAADRAAEPRGLDAIARTPVPTARALDDAQATTDIPAFARPQAAGVKPKRILEGKAPC